MRRAWVAHASRVPVSASRRNDQINEAYERMLKSDVKYRFVIDMSTLI